MTPQSHPPEKIVIRYLEADGNLGTGNLDILEESQADPDRVEISLRLPGFERTATAYDYFQALVEIRLELE